MVVFVVVTVVLVVLKVTVVLMVLVLVLSRWSHRSATRSMIIQEADHDQPAFSPLTTVIVQPRSPLQTVNTPINHHFTKVFNYHHHQHSPSPLILTTAEAFHKHGIAGTACEARGTRRQRETGCLAHAFATQPTCGTGAGQLRSPGWLRSWAWLKGAGWG